MALMPPVTRGSMGDSGRAGRALPRVRGPVVAAGPPSPKPRSTLTPLGRVVAGGWQAGGGRLVARRGPGAREEWAFEPPRLPQPHAQAQAHAQAFLDRLREETSILRDASSAPTQGQGLGGNPVAGWLSMANPPPGPQGARAGGTSTRVTGVRALELARTGSLVQTPAQAQALAGARVAPALASEELVIATSLDIGEEALAGAGGAPALATGGGRSLW